MAYPLRVLLQLSALHFLWEGRPAPIFQRPATVRNRPEGGGAWLLLL